MKKYYIYEWFNIETNEIFYVGKGCKNRYAQITGRNKFFIDYYNTHKCCSRKIYEGLTEKEAFQKEIETISHYKKNTKFRLTNQTEGGDGHPFKCGELNPKFGKGSDIMGSSNPFYGKKHRTDTRKILSEKATQRVGNLNPFYGKKHSETTKRILSEKASQKTGDLNPFYGKHHSEETRKKLSDIAKNRRFDCVCKICKNNFKGKSWNSSKCSNCK